LKKLYPFLHKERKLAAISLGTLSISTAITLCVPAGMGTMIDAVRMGEDVNSLVVALGALFGVFQNRFELCWNFIW
jgi:hypothetical protein